MIVFSILLVLGVFLVVILALMGIFHLTDKIFDKISKKENGTIP